MLRSVPVEFNKHLLKGCSHQLESLIWVKIEIGADVSDYMNHLLGSEIVSVAARSRGQIAMDGASSWNAYLKVLTLEGGQRTLCLRPR
jgi:hypothetical protein